MVEKLKEVIGFLKLAQIYVGEFGVYIEDNLPDLQDDFDDILYMCLDDLDFSLSNFHSLLKKYEDL